MNYEEMLDHLKHTASTFLGKATDSALKKGAEVLTKAADAAAQEIERTARKTVAEVQSVATLAAVNATEAAVKTGTDLIDHIGDAFSPVLEKFMKKLKKASNHSTDNLSSFKKFGIELAKNLHDHLEDVRKAFVEHKTLTVNQFKSECKQLIDSARPELEKHLDGDFVKLLLTPVIEFLEQAGLSWVAGFFKSKSTGAENDSAQVANEAEAVQPSA